jgi:ABC-2 type transport system ATP-binding protein
LFSWTSRTNGLDPKGQAQMLELVQSLWKCMEFLSVLSSHLLHDVDRICEQIIIIARGRVLVHDTLENMKARRRGAAEVVVATRHQELNRRVCRNQWPCELLPNGHLKVEHRAVRFGPAVASHAGNAPAPAGDHSQPQCPVRNVRASPGDFLMLAA